MEFVVKESRPSDGLPAMSYLDGIKHAGAEYPHRRPSLTGLNASNGVPASPMHMYSGPPPPYSYPASTISAMPALTGLASPPDSRRTSGDEKESRTVLKHSLPSIHEALGPTQAIPYAAPPPAPITTSHPAPSSPRNHTAGPSPTAPIPRSHPPDPPRLDRHATSHAPAHTSFPPQPPSASSASSFHATYPPTEGRRPSLPSAFGADRLPSVHALRTAASPEQPSRPDRYSHPYGHSPPRTEPQTPTSAVPVNGAQGYSHHQPPYPYSAPSSHGAHAPTQPAMPYNSHQGSYPARYDGPDAGRGPEVQQESFKTYKSVNGERYGTSVKRHLDYFDLDNSLNEIVEGSARVHDFSRDFKDRARELPRTGPGPGVLPSIAECDAMIMHQGHVQDLLVRLRDMLVTQQNALASQQGSEQRYKGHGDYDLDDGGMYDDGKGPFTGPEAKKRRGRAAPPGRCHSCNRAETPEWRRGPDGARTLCNACGLHYAKLTRKMGNNNMRPGCPPGLTGAPPIRPKSVGPGSPQ